MTRLKTLFFVGPIFSLTVAVGCPGPTDDDGGTSDDGGALDDAGVDAGPDVDAGPTPEVEDGFFVSDLHSAPAACGAEPYAWWGTGELGEVLYSERVHAWDTGILETLSGLLDGQTALARTPQHDVNVYRIRYRTQDRGKRVDATGMVALPIPTAGETAFPTLLYLHGTEGMSDKCSPSLDIAFGGEDYANAIIVGLLSSWGYVVVAPDYLGLKSLGEPSENVHPYLVGEPTAVVSLDAVRAGQRLVDEANLGILPGDLVVLGASQGGHAAAFVTRYAPHYAPEFDVRAAVYGIPATDFVGHSIDSIQNPDATRAGNTAMFLVGANDWYRSSENGLSDALRDPLPQDMRAYIEDNCGIPGITGSVEQIFMPGLVDAAGVEGFGDYAPWDCYVRENSAVDTSVERLDDTPALMIVAEDDERINPVVERASLEKLCDQGHRVAYIECEDANHIEGFFFSVDNAFDFIDARLAGDPMPDDTCQLSAPQKCQSDPR